MGLVLMYDLFFPLCYFAMTERRREWPRGTLRGGGGGGAALAHRLGYCKGGWGVTEVEGGCKDEVGVGVE